MKLTVLALALGLVVFGLTMVKTTVTATGPTVSTSQGKVSGFERKSREGRIFQGWTKIPYAKPPVMHLRFMPPQPLDKWQGVIDATQNAPACMQKRAHLSRKTNVTLSEDCLYLNVFSPKTHSLKYLPVLVYIHGGGYISGSVGGRQNADYLMDEDVILVEIAYRLGLFGFMSLNDDVVPGNNGMKDQVRALEWIKYNIKAFGGDPKNITVFGESAGGSSAHLLLKSPLSKDLIKGAVSHSGTANPVWSLIKADTMKELTLEIANIFGCSQLNSAYLLKCLQDVEGDKLSQAFDEVDKSPFRPAFAPVVELKTIEGAFATEDFSLIPTSKPWINTFTNGEYLAVPAALKKHANKMPDFFNNPSSFVMAMLPQTRDPVQQEMAVFVLNKTYFRDENSTMENFWLAISKMVADKYMTYPAMITTETHCGPRWLAVLEYAPNLRRAKGNDEKAPHASNTMFYFNQTDLYPETTSSHFVAASKRMIKYLVNFAYHSDPTPPGSSFVWPRYETNEILRMTSKGDIVGSQSIYNHLHRLKNVWDLAHGWN